MGREIWLEGISTRILFFRIIVWEIAARSTTGLIEINVVKKKKGNKKKTGGKIGDSINVKQRRSSVERISNNFHP